MKARWHILRDGDALTLCRHLPPRFDIAAHTHLSAGGPVRLAHQIRQDIWRALSRVRGFSPVVHLEPDGHGWAVTAGGRTLGPASGQIVERIARVLDDPQIRARWMNHARVRS
ncbi:MAG: hypothetical protein AAF727_05675 [Pseudomonadota bacterium]